MPPLEKEHSSELETYEWDEIKKHDKEDDAWVVKDGQVYDVSKFLKEHPGGASIVIPSVPQPAPLFLCRTNPEKGRYGQAFRPYLSFPTRCCSWTPLLDYMTCTHLRKLAGKSSFPDEFGMSRYLGSDIGEVFEDEDHHVHSDAAHAMMDRYRIGYLAGAPRARPVKRGKDFSSVEFDWNKPIIFQIGKLGDQYSEFIHTPQVMDEPARFFEYDFMEFFSRTSWWAVPTVWVPVVLGVLAYTASLPIAAGAMALYYLAGLLFWSFLEYSLHRWLFHLDEWVQFSTVTITLHFLLHGVHHLLPMDPMRLVFPPVLTLLLACPIYSAFRLLLAEPEANCMLAGGLTGYMAYDLTHYYLHHSGKPCLSYFRELKTYHLNHHYKNHHLGYGITSKVWDFVFGTVLHEGSPSFKAAKAA